MIPPDMQGPMVVFRTYRFPIIMNGNNESSISCKTHGREKKENDYCRKNGNDFIKLPQ